VYPLSAHDPRVTTIQNKDQFWIVLDDPRTKNAIDEPLISALAHAIETAPPGILVLTGKNGGFSTGGKLTTVSELSDLASTDPAGVAQTVRRGGNIIEDLLVSPATTVALIDGACAGAGLGIALACDYRIATPRSRFTTAYGRLGLPSDFGTHELLRRQIGVNQADHLMETSTMIDAAGAQDMGLIDVLIEKPDRKAVKRALKGLPAPSRSNRMAGMSAILDAEADEFARALTRPDVQIALERAHRASGRD